MSSIARCIVRTGSLLGAVTLAFALALPARADGPPVYIFGGKPIVFSHIVAQSAGLAIGVDDPGLREILRDVDAALTYRPGSRYVLLTTAEPRVISFAIGDTRYDAGATSSQAAFAPFERDGIAYVPLNELLRSLDLSIKHEGGDDIIQPQLSSVDVVSDAGRSSIIARAGVPLHPRLVSQTRTELVFAFDGVGTTLQRTRAVRAAGVAQIEVVQSGDARYPVTTVTLDLTNGASHGVADSDDGRDFTIALSGPAGNGVAVATLPLEPSAQPAVAPTVGATPLPAEEPTATLQGPAVSTVDAVVAQSSPGGLKIDVTVTGDATFDWHRLRDPDNRFWIDVHDATLTIPPRDDQETGPASALRIRQFDASTVRVTVALTGAQRLDVTPNATGVEIVIHPDTVADDVARSGIGTIGAQVVGAAPNAQATSSPVPSGAGWKFGGGSSYVAANPRMIAIDPGHGGSDPGTVVGSVHEAVINLDIAKRLRDILIARGWQVVMTRTTDVDVVAPYDSAHVELQGRDDIAYGAGARLLVSVHVNAYLNSGPHGTTTYYAKPADMTLARAIDHRVGTQLDSRDDGVVKDDLYITLHAKMPAALIETAFITNPGDLALLTSAQWRQKVAQAIADGIGDYAGTPPPVTQSTNQ